MPARRSALRLMLWLLVGALVLAACGLRQRQNRAAPTATPLATAITLTGGTLAPATASAADPTLAPTAGEPTATSAPTEPALGPLSFETGRNDYVALHSR